MGMAIMRTSRVDDLGEGTQDGAVQGTVTQRVAEQFGISGGQQCRKPPG